MPFVLWLGVGDKQKSRHVLRAMVATVEYDRDSYKHVSIRARKLLK